MCVVSLEMGRCTAGPLRGWNRDIQIPWAVLRVFSACGKGYRWMCLVLLGCQMCVFLLIPWAQGSQGIDGHWLGLVGMSSRWDLTWTNWLKLNLGKLLWSCPSLLLPRGCGLEDSWWPFFCNIPGSCVSTFCITIVMIGKAKLSESPF